MEKMKNKNVPNHQPVKNDRRFNPTIGNQTTGNPLAEPVPTPR
jgi:hypothetical protein